jgi:hypothetical protein
VTLDSGQFAFIIAELIKRHDVITTLAVSQIICRWQVQSYKLSCPHKDTWKCEGNKDTWKCEGNKASMSALVQPEYTVNHLFCKDLCTRVMSVELSGLG